MSKSLPRNWTLGTISDIAEVNPPASTVAAGDRELVTFLPMAAVEELSGKIDVSTARPFIEVKKNFTRFREDDVLFAKITPSMENGKVAVARGLRSGIGCGTTEFHVIRPAPEVAPDYLRLFLVQARYRQEAKRNMQGAVGQQRVPPDFVRESPVPVAPAKEQQRIVSKIDELFSRIEEGEQALKRVEKLVERYRQSVLKAAVTGELTRDWREARKRAGEPVESGEALLARVLKARREAWEASELAKLKAKGKVPSDDRWKQKYVEPAVPETTGLPELPEGWVWANLDCVTECLDYARIPVSARERATRPGAIPYYGANGQVGTIDRHLFDESLVLVVEDETFTGRTKPFSYKIEGKTWVNNHAHVLRPTSALDVDFLNTSLMHYPFIPLTTGTTARRKLTQKALMSAVIAIPCKDEQAEITSIVRCSLSGIERVQADAVRAPLQGAALRQSILKVAFCGQLVPQDPNDEPASKLLERIAAERAETAPAIRKRKKKVA